MDILNCTQTNPVTINFYSVSRLFLVRNQQYNLMIHESFDQFIKLFLSFTNHPISAPSYDLCLLFRLCKLFFGFENCYLSLAGPYLEI